MNRYFLEVAYKGTRYSGFQVQENAKTIQSEIEGRSFLQMEIIARERERRAAFDSSIG